MNNTIALPHIISSLAKIAGTDEATATAFVSEFVTLIETALAKGEKVTIKQIGTFEPAEPISFEASAELAARVNAAFAIFEPVELPEDYSEEEPLSEATIAAAELEPADGPTAVDVPEADDATQPEPEAEPEPAPAAEADTMVEPETAPEAEAEPESDESEADESEADEQPEVETPAPEAAPEAAPDDIIAQPRVKRTRSWLWCVLTLAVGFAAGYYTGSMSGHDDAVNKVDEPVAVSADTVRVAPRASDDSIAATAATTISKPSPQIERYDTITKSRFLTTMSRKYYGRMEYWVYIYLENADRLGHPDRIAPGTRVKIPPIEKYATATTDSANLAAAQSRAIEIYGRFK